MKTEKKLTLLLALLFLKATTSMANIGAPSGGLNAIYKNIWTGAQVVIGVLVIYNIITIATGLMSGGEDAGRNTGRKVMYVLIGLVIWYAVPAIATTFGLTL